MRVACSAWPRLRLAITAGAAALLALSGCTHSPGADINQHECVAEGPADPYLKQYPSASPVVKVIEITDLGEHVRRCQYTEVLYELARVRQPEVILLYIHGWKHSAAGADDDLRRFKELVERINQRELASARGKPRHVVGIFIGWRGASTHVPGLEELTFWGRKRAAERISQSAILTKIIGAIDHIRCLRNQPDDLVVFAGHSLGAGILFNATSQLLIHNVQMQHPSLDGGTYGIVRGVADVMVLLNPAFEASTYTALDSIRRTKEKFSYEQQPVLLVVSTENDWATKTAFPMGQRLELLTHDRQTTTLGNYEAYRTHRLTKGGGAGAVSQHEQSSWYDGYCQDTVCLVRQTGDRQPNNPYVVATTTREILDGHNGIWKPDFQDWLVGFVGEVDQRLRTQTIQDRITSFCKFGVVPDGRR
jgi:hypothetical protein